MHNNRIEIGRLGKAKGLKGAIKFDYYGNDESMLDHYGVFYQADGAVLEILDFAWSGSTLTVFFKGIEQRQDAERLQGEAVYIDEADLPDLSSEAEIYHRDLVGCSVLDSEGEEKGVVLSVQNFGAEDLLDIKVPEQKQTVLLPWRSELFRATDLKEKQIIMNAEGEAFFDL